MLSGGGSRRNHEATASGLEVFALGGRFRAARAALSEARGNQEARHGGDTGELWNAWFLGGRS